MSVKRVAENIYNQIANKKLPKILIPDRTKKNVILDKKSGSLVIGDRKIVRRASSLSTVKSFAQLTWLIYYIQKELIEKRKTTTQRDIFYASLNIKDIAFKKQQESNNAIVDLEALTGLTREEFNIYPGERAVIFGDIEYKYREPREWIRNPGKVYALNEHPDGFVIGPELVSNTDILSCNAENILIVEKQALFRRFVEDGVYKKFNAVLVFTKGQPPRDCRLFIKRLVSQFKLKPFILCDCDPWGLAIALTIKYGSINLAHLKNLTVPNAEWIGITPSDIVEFRLPTIDFNDKDEKRLQNLFKDVRCKHDKFIYSQLKLWKKMKKKCELESFTKFGLSFIVDEYLKNKIS